VRLDITEESHDELASLQEDDPRATLFQVYDWLTFLQESLVQRLLMSD
jgi:Fe2+ or Zn2+ uptake regulation protein